MVKKNKMAITVSIVEDDAGMREILVDWVNHADGFRCVSNHSSGEAAVEAIPKHKPQVVIMDINLPGINGVESVRRLKPLLPTAQFVMLTVYEDEDHIFQALQAGATGYLLKHTIREDLMTALRDLSGGGSPMTTNIARKVVQAFAKVTTPKPGVADLSARESEVLQLLARGYLYKEIADELKVAVPTVNTYIRRVYEKLHVRSRGEAVAIYTHMPVRGDANPKARQGA